MNRTKIVVNKLLEGKPVRKVLESTTLSSSDIKSFIDLMDEYPVIKGDYFLWLYALAACSEKFNTSLNDNYAEAEQDFEYWASKNWNFKLDSDNDGNCYAASCKKAGVTAEQLEKYVIDHVGDLYELESISVDHDRSGNISLIFVEK